MAERALLIKHYGDGKAILTALGGTKDELTQMPTMFFGPQATLANFIEAFTHTINERRKSTNVLYKNSLPNPLFTDILREENQKKGKKGVTETTKVPNKNRNMLHAENNTSQINENERLK